MNDWLAILAEPLDAQRAVEFVTDPSAGGIDLFAGTTRAQTSDAGQTLAALDYEAYEPMAMEQLRVLAREARAKWPVAKLVILHRIGRVAVAEPSVLIAVSTPHRAQAFEACRWLIDTLKERVAIWKKEIWSDGSGVWVEGSAQGREK
ncbi:MAG: molybdenum cofactor biosynthesis protein MoaE [Tepidisphaeraceae bacterium]|jgi:molybdopterin synthase catalytic subunit